jgi:cellulose synthase operon protein C
MQPARRLTPPRRLLAAACAALALGVAAQGNQGSRFFEDALQRYEKKDFTGAIVQLKNVLRTDSRNLSAQLLLGKSLLETGDAAGAEVALAEALRLGASRAELVLPLANSLIAQGQQQRLLSDPRLALADLPTPVQAQMLLLRAAAAADLGDPRQAFKDIEQARTLQPDDAGSYLAEAPLRIRAQKYKEAQALADRALALAPQRAEVHYLLGQVAHVQANLPKALQHYAKALEIQPTHTEALVSRAGLAIDQQRYDAARADVAVLRKAAQNDPRGAYLAALIAEKDGKPTEARAAFNDAANIVDQIPPDYLRFRPQLLTLGGVAHYSLGQRTKAKPYLEMALRLTPGSPVSKMLANIYLGENALDPAAEALEAYLRNHPQDSQAVLMLASVQMAQGRHARALQLTQEALKRDDSAEMRTAVGLSLIGTGSFERAVAELEKVFAKDPGGLRSGTALVTTYLQGGQPRKALRVAEAMNKRHPQNPGVFQMLGSAREQLGDAAGARTAYENAARLDAGFAAPNVALARLDSRRGDDTAASAKLSAVLAREPLNIDALVQSAALFERRGSLVEAQRFLEKADDHAGARNLQPGLALVELLLRNGKAPEAREAARRLTNRSPEALPVLMASARVSLATGDLTAARSALSRAATQATYDAIGLSRVALLQVQAGDLRAAAHSLDKALAAQPKLPAARALMAEVEIKLGELAKAEQRARAIATELPTLGVGHALLGDVAMARRQPAAAVPHYQRAHGIDKNAESLLRLYAAQRLANPAEATRTAERWLQTSPNDTLVRRVLADGHAAAGNHAAARSGYEALLKVAPKDAETLNNLANVLILQGDGGALKVAEQALALKPGAPHIIGTTGWAAFKAGQNDRALQLLRDARLRAPGNPDTRYFLGAVLASVGRQAEARDELQGALQAAPEFAHAAAAKALLQTLR